MAHVGVPVPDIDAALDWYEEILDFQRLLGPVEVDGDEERGNTTEKAFRRATSDFESVYLAHK